MCNEEERKKIQPKKLKRVLYNKLAGLSSDCEALCLCLRRNLFCIERTISVRKLTSILKTFAPTRFDINRRSII